VIAQQRLEFIFRQFTLVFLYTRACFHVQMRGFNDFLRCELKTAKVGVTLLSPGQVRGTGYFAHNAVNMDHLPCLFRLGLDHSNAYDCAMVAERALLGCEGGECEVHVPGPAVSLPSSAFQSTACFL